jgi:ABC-type transport system involved in cytochrome c biogenesis ATPase subunit
VATPLQVSQCEPGRFQDERIGDGASFTDGEVVALAGENGAGKSTIKNIIGGTLRPTPRLCEWTWAPGGMSSRAMPITSPYL